MKKSNSDGRPSVEQLDAIEERLDREQAIGRAVVELAEGKNEIVELNIGDVKITFLDRKGNSLKRGCGDLALLCNFLIEGAGIDPLRVKSVELPKLDYNSSEAVTIKVELYPVDFDLPKPRDEFDCQK